MVGVVGGSVGMRAAGVLGEMTDGAAGRALAGGFLLAAAAGTSPKFGNWSVGAVELYAPGRDDSVAEARLERVIQVAAAAMPALTNIRVTKATARVRRCCGYRGRRPSGVDGDIGVHSSHRSPVERA